MPAQSFVDRRRSLPFSSLPHLLEHQARRIPDAPAILAPGRASLSYGRLYRHIEQIGRTLRSIGIGRHDRAVVILPNGPEMAVAMLAVAANATCAPINPAYGAAELERCFAELRPRALITAAGTDSPARRAALSGGVRVLELSTAEQAEAGLFALSGEPPGALSAEPVSSGDVALLLLTSGTTSQPKIVPLTHANICSSAHSWGVALALGETDRCLNVVPLFHGNFIANVLASLAAGGSVVCAPGCDPSRFFGWLTGFLPTWYAAVPTMHQAILGEARRRRPPLSDRRLRFVRSSSAPLPARVVTELERTLAIPVIEAYGMTETAAAPLACNPLPPRRRKVGSVGLPVGLEVAIREEAGALLPAGRTGQVVVRGASVMSGYDGDPAARRADFADGWFKTRDCGYFDDDGYLFLTGRTEELINRGGEKIAPGEVDDLLLQHPAVAEAATFAAPHPTLGDDVASAVVLRPHATATANDIRRFASGRIAEFKVPRRILIVDELPKSATGKVQRVGLAARLGLSGAGNPMRRSFVAPRTRLERMLAGCWREVLDVEQVGIDDDFFALGGDSLSVAKLAARVYATMALEIEVSHVFDAPTVAEMARHLEALSVESRAGRPFSAIARAAREDAVPASLAQERLCRLQRVLRDTPFFNGLYPLRLISVCDRAILERSLDEIVRRHEILRTTFAVVDGRYVQVIAPELRVTLRFDDLRELPDSEKDIVGQQIIRQELLHSFDLAKGPLLLSRLVRLADEEHLLLITMHQTIGDGWSLGVLVDELVALYDAFSIGEAPPLAPLSMQYADFAYWQSHWQAHPDIVAQLAYWRGQLRDPLPIVGLAAARPRRTVDDFLTARRPLAIPPDLSEAARRFAQSEGGTLFMALVAALKTLLHRYLAQDDLRVATLVANRHRPGTERLIGPLVNTVVLRTDLAGDPSSREVMRRVRATTVAAFANQDLPFEALVDALAAERAIEPSALAQVMITLHNATLRPLASSGRTLVLEEANPGMLMPLAPATTFDITLALHEVGNGILGSCVYKPHSFEAAMMDRLLRDFGSVLDEMVREPERRVSAIPLSME
jgi:acyl-CoA synthetase (AMP-forming)/AMP-acid ligase II